ncbi:helix-turn-helix DNA-binding domain protein [Mycobacterium phage Danforth]|nr:helix-turn-helix DNA-binding domain protein [Mycobacterium phage Danforth]
MTDLDGVYALLDELQTTVQRIVAENTDLRRRTSGQVATIATAFAKGRENRKKLTDREVRAIRDAARLGRKQVDLAYDYDVNPATISRIVRGIYHKGAA